MVFFIKYEFWPNYLNELKKQSTNLVSVFRKIKYFQMVWFLYKALDTFTYFFVQNEQSKNY
jgi:3-deoxy-D-manno-octulosonic-acid transferase